MSDEIQLKKLLADWRVQPSPAPGFQRAVWGRIEHVSRRRAVLGGVGQWLLFSLPRPLYASALVAIFALSGLLFADLSSARLHRRERARQEQRYMASIDPLSMANQSTDLGQ
jgi:hypothetical protein